MLLDNFQYNFLDGKFPVSKEVFERRVYEAINPQSTSYIESVVGYGYVNLYVDPLSIKEAERIEALIDSLTIIPEDEFLWNIVSESAMEYFNDKMTAEDAARIIQSRASIYISEQSG